MVKILGSVKISNGTVKRGEHVYDSKMNPLGTVRNIYKFELSGVVVNVLNENGIMKKYQPGILYKG